MKFRLLAGVVYPGLVAIVTACGGTDCPILQPQDRIPQPELRPRDSQQPQPRPSKPRYLTSAGISRIAQSPAPSQVAG